MRRMRRVPDADLVLVYEPGDDADVPLLRWYLALVERQELLNIFGNPAYPLHLFFQAFTDRATTLFCAVDEQGEWWATFWVRPFMAGASWGLWIRPDCRGAPDAVEFVRQCHAIAFQAFPFLVLSTHQSAVVAKAQRLGYTMMSTIPGMYGPGLDGWLMYMTRTAFQSAAGQARFDTMHAQRRQRSS